VASDAGAIHLVATRMRHTLEEVLGRKRGAAMYDHAWLVDRVRQHLDGRLDGGAGRLAWHGGELVGHVLLRTERDEHGLFGLFSTIWVQPSARRQGVAGALIGAGEAWHRAQGLTRHATYTAHDNHRLHALFGKHGYRCSAPRGEMVILSREVATTPSSG